MIRLPGWRATGDGQRRFVAAMGEWVYSPALGDLVDHFGGGPVPEPLAAALRYLDEFSADVWDFRHGRERHQSVAPDFPRGTADRVREHARTLGLSGQGRPGQQRYDHVLVLGGRIRACLLRARFAAGLLRSGIAADDVVGLGSLRPVDDSERQHAADLSANHSAPARLATEFDAMDMALRDAFHFTAATAATEVGGEPPEHARTGWRLRTYPGSPRTRLVAAPSSEPLTRRANTADTLGFWARTAGISADHRLLLVTSSIHATFQHCDAVRVLGLPFGCAIDTVGADPSAVPDDRLRLRWDTATLLQEIRSTIRSLRHLHHDISQWTPRRVPTR